MNEAVQIVQDLGMVLLGAMLATVYLAWVVQKACKKDDRVDEAWDNFMRAIRGKGGRP